MAANTVTVNVKGAQQITFTLQPPQPRPVNLLDTLHNFWDQRTQWQINAETTVRQVTAFESGNQGRNPLSSRDKDNIARAVSGLMGKNIRGWSTFTDLLTKPKLELAKKIIKVMEEGADRDTAIVAVGLPPGHVLLNNLSTNHPNHPSHAGAPPPPPPQPAATSTVAIAAVPSQGTATAAAALTQQAYGPTIDGQMLIGQIQNAQAQAGRELEFSEVIGIAWACRR